MYVIFKKSSGRTYFYTAKTGSETWTENLFDAVQYDHIVDARVIASCLPYDAMRETPYNSNPNYGKYNGFVSEYHRTKLGKNAVGQAKSVYNKYGDGFWNELEEFAVRLGGKQTF